MPIGAQPGLPLLIEVVTGTVVDDEENLATTVARSCPARFAGLPDGTAIYPVVVVTTQGAALAAEVDATKETSGGVAVMKIDILISGDSKCSVVVFP